MAVSYSCYFLNILTGRKPLTGAEKLATQHGWAAFARVRRRVPSRFRNVRVRRMACPSDHIAEIVAVVEDGRLHQAMTFTFRATGEGWRLDDCELIGADRRRRPMGV
ncbi:Rv3235 family protein [Glycomyces arizonensis]|uniref:Rv3235 family protein n=1 Tax=Glycomyces arizonensis TaxID=256035 RepID=UPI000418CF87|nr:Rv3235 family protein [Glycomyces arizonensis]